MSVSYLFFKKINDKHAFHWLLFYIPIENVSFKCIFHHARIQNLQIKLKNQTTEKESNYWLNNKEYHNSCL